MEGIDIPFMEINPVKALQKMGMNIDAREIQDDWDLPAPVVNHYPQWQRWIDEFMGHEREIRPYHRRTRDELRADIHLSLDFALRDGVFTSEGPVSEKASKALKEWLKLLHKTLPEAWEVHKLIDELLSNYLYIIKNEAYLTHTLDQHPPESNQWSEACSHGDPDAGYTCGLWELFHAMTVGVVRYNMENPEHRRIATEDAALTLRDYVEHFFGCIECRQNFLKMVDSCAFDRCTRLDKEVKGLSKEKEKDWAELPLWLFEAHNHVNVRLLHERAARENREVTPKEETAVLWPIKEECLLCWNSKKSMKAQNVTWDLPNVYTWLRLEYGPWDSAAVTLRNEFQQLTEQVERKMKRKKRIVKTSYGSALAAFLFVSGLCIKVRRRLATGRHKKVDKKMREPLLRGSLDRTASRNLPPSRTSSRTVLQRKSGALSHLAAPAAGDLHI